MLRFILRRLLYAVVTIWTVITLTFVMMHSLPGDPLRNPQKISADQKKQLYHEMGLDKPIYQQYFIYLGNVAKGNLGTSYAYPGRSTNGMISQGFQSSAEIGAETIIVATFLGLLFGVAAALRQGTWVDYALMTLAVIGISVPSYVIGPIIQWIFGVKLHVLPVAFFKPIVHTNDWWNLANWNWGNLSYRVMPVTALSFLIVATMARFMRASMLDVIGQDYIKTAKSKGLSPSAIVRKHQLRNAILPIVTLFGVMLVNIITGTFIVEQIFVIPGMGHFYVDSVETLDYTVIMGITIFYSVLLVIAMFLTDVIYGLVDPRIRLSGGGK